MEILTTAATKLLEYTITPIIRQGGYIIHCKSNLHTLHARVEELMATRGRVHNDIVAAERRGETIQPDVLNWIKNVDETTGKAGKLLKDEHQAKMKCLHGFCPNPLTRHQLGRKSTKLLVEVVEWNGKGVLFPSSISCGGRAEEVFLTSTKDYEAFDSRIQTLTRIIDELKSPDTNKIGVYGIGGVGKSTLAEEVVRQVMKDGLFEDVVMVRDVKENPDIGRIQKEIAEKLGMDSNALENHSTAEKARQICGRINNKKTLVVLDDLWSPFDLKAVGLPDVVTCKILMTSRDGGLLSEKMGTQRDFPLAALKEKESWSLFESKAGEIVRDPDIRIVATEVANRCRGLPIFVVTVASSLKKGTLPEWENALTRLKKFEKKGLAEQAFLALQWSYDRLDDEELKPVFLLCGVIAWKNSISLDDLFKFAMGLGLLKDVDDTMGEARNSLLSLVIKLKGFSLLLDHDDDGFVRMHDLVHDVANDIASREGRLLSVACGAEFESWPKNSKCSKISIKSDSLAKLSEVLDCQKLEMFSLRCEGNDQLQVPENFLANMEKLKVLGLRKVKINLTSLGFLKNLLTLRLHSCQVEDIAPVGELRTLEILSMVGNYNIKQLPEQIGKLTCLRLLDLTGCYMLQVIAPHVLSRLTRLEELRMKDSFIEWEPDGEGERRSNASLTELTHLSLLATLEITISNPDMLPQDLFSEQLERFHIFIGYNRDYEERSLNTLALRFTTGGELGQGLKMLMKRAEDLTLEGGEKVIEFPYQLEGHSVAKVKHLKLIDLHNTTYIIHSKVVFSSLTTLDVVRCNDIKSLLSFSTARNLAQLEYLCISDCGSMVEIVSVQQGDRENKMDIMFPNLVYLKLDSLPNLVTFYSGCRAEFLSLDKNGGSRDNLLGAVDVGVNSVIHKTLFNEKVIFPSLQNLDLRRLPNLNAVWQNLNQLAPDSFCRLTRVSIVECMSLIDLFVPCVVERLNDLETLYVRGCPDLEVIFKCGGEKFKETHDVSTREIHFPNLRELDIQFADRLKYIIEVMERLETIPKFLFPNVTRIYFDDLPHLKSIYPGNHVSQWPSLQYLAVLECGQVEAVAGELSVCHENQWSTSRSDTITQPLISFEKGSSIFTDLKTLRIFGDTQMWSGPPPAQFCINLESVYFFGGATISKHAIFLQTSHNLEMVTLDGQHDAYREIILFVDEGNCGEAIHPVGNLPQVKKLEIMYMDHLMHIQNKSSPSAVSLFPNLEKLSVGRCSALKNLDTSTISFQNLTSLTVDCLQGLEYLVSYRIARDLMQLRKLKIIGCERMEVIVATEDDDDAAHHEIAFSWLKYLKLENLPHLQGLCSESCTLEFPSLETLHISERLRKKLFSDREMRCVIYNN